MTDASTPAPPRQRPYLRARVERIFDHAADTRSLFLTTLDGVPLRFLPGMFISISIPLAAETRVRPYSIASNPEDAGPFEICFNRVPDGPGAAWLFDRRVGDPIQYTGPFGAFTLDRAPVAETIFIAQGTGIAPIRPMIRRALAAAPDHPIRLLHGADCADHILYRAEFDRMAAGHREFHFDTIVAGGDLDAVYASLIGQAERRWVKADSDRARHFYICGVGRGVLALRDLLRGAGYERRSVRYEQW